MDAQSLTGRCTIDEDQAMKQPGLDDRHRDEDGEIRKKRGDTLNKNLDEPIKGFRGDAKLQTMRDATGKESIEAVRRAAAKRGR